MAFKAEGTHLCREGTERECTQCGSIGRVEGMTFKGALGWGDCSPQLLSQQVLNLLGKE